MTEDRWLGDLLALPAYRIAGQMMNGLPPDILPSGPLFAYVKVPVDDLQSCASLSAAGFRLVDTAVTLDKPLCADGGDNPDAVRPARPSDQARLAEIAAVSFRQTRFHADSRISDSTARAIKAAWVSNYFTGTRGTHMIVADRNGRPTGFCLMIADGSRVVIDLIAVAPESQGSGVGTAMLRFAETSFRDHEVLVVGTQIANTGSLRFYTKHGFRPASAEHVFHLMRT